MKVSIIVSAFNAADILPKTLPSLFNQDYPEENYEIILVNDASTDTTLDLIKSEKWTDQCIVFHHEKNLGRSATRNTGLRAASGDLLIFIDCDIEVSSDFISRNVIRHREKDIVGLLCNLQPAVFPNDKYHLYLSRNRRGAKSVGGKAPLPYRYFILTATSIKRTAIEKTGEFSENLSGYGIDLHYAHRLWKNFPQNLFFDPDITVRQYKLKHLHEALTDFYDYGTKNMPVIVSEFPALAKDLGADYVSDGTIKVVLGSIIFNPIVRSAAVIMNDLLPSPFCNPFIRYRMADALLTGYKDFINKVG